MEVPPGALALCPTGKSTSLANDTKHTCTRLTSPVEMEAECHRLWNSKLPRFREGRLRRRPPNSESFDHRTILSDIYRLRTVNRTSKTTFFEFLTATRLSLIRVCQSFRESARLTDELQGDFVARNRGAHPSHAPAPKIGRKLREGRPSLMSPPPAPATAFARGQRRPSVSWSCIPSGRGVLRLPLVFVLLAFQQQVSHLSFLFFPHAVATTSKAKDGPWTRSAGENEPSPS